VPSKKEEKTKVSLTREVTSVPKSEEIKLGKRKKAPFDADALQTHLELPTENSCDDLLSDDKENDPV
jgi:hypothetical protein